MSTIVYIQVAEQSLGHSYRSRMPWIDSYGAQTPTEAEPASRQLYVCAEDY